MTRARRLLGRVPTAFAWRYICHSLMIGLALLHEPLAAPTLPDRVLELIPYSPWIARHNYGLWLLCYLPPALWLWRRDRPAFVHFLYVGGVISLARGLCIPLTGLGPPMGGDPNVGLQSAILFDAWLDLINPLTALGGDAPALYLTKDLFFSGHTATTFLVLLYCARQPGLRWLAAAGHVLTVAIVLFAHLHYSIDIIGAWAITFAIYTVASRVAPPSAPGSRLGSAGPNRLEYESDVNGNAKA